MQYGSAPSDYSTDVFANMAQSFIQGAPAGKPLFLYFAPRAPHKPSTPPVRYQNACGDLQPLRPPSYNEKDMSDKPSWLQQVHKLSPTQMARIDLSHLNHCKSLLAVDDAVQTIVNALQSPGGFEHDDRVRLRQRHRVRRAPLAEQEGRLRGEHPHPHHRSRRRHRGIRGPRGLAPGDEHRLRADVRRRGRGVRAGSRRTSFLPLFSARRRRGEPTSSSSTGSPRTAGPWATSRPIAACTRRTPSTSSTRTANRSCTTSTPTPTSCRTRRTIPAYAGEVAQMHARMVQLCNPPPPGFVP